VDLIEWGRKACWYLHTEGKLPFHLSYRWTHYLSAGVYIGLLLFLNLLLERGEGDEAWIGRALLERVFLWWRWAAMLFFFTGLNLLHMLYNFPTGNYFDEDKGLWMAVGASLGFASWLVVWFWVWPAQKRHFERWKREGAVAAPLAPRAAAGVRVLTLSLPVLVMGMMAGGHGLTLFSWGWRDVAWTIGVGSGSVAAVYALAARRARVRP
jgi:hypothetical protein